MHPSTAHAAIVEDVRRALDAQSRDDMRARSEAIQSALSRIVLCIGEIDVTASAPSRHLVELYFACASALDAARRDPRSSGVTRAAALLAPLELLLGAA
jgi:hypothetical protein